MKICIFNDRKVPMHLTVQNFDQSTNSHTIPPASAKFVEVFLGLRYAPYIKIWENNQAFLSFIDTILENELNEKI